MIFAVFRGIFLGVILRWIYSVAVNVIRSQAPWCFGSWIGIGIRLVVALVTTFFVFSGYWQVVKDRPGVCAYGMRWRVASPWM